MRCQFLQKGIFERAAVKQDRQRNAINVTFISIVTLFCLINLRINEDNKNFDNNDNKDINNFCQLQNIFNLPFSLKFFLSY